MGSCISKCKPKKTHKKEKLGGEESKCKEKNNITLVEDKVVISQAPISSCPPPSNKPLSCPTSPPNVPSSRSSSCPNSNCPTTSSSSSSCSFLSSASSSSGLSSELNPSMEDPHIVHHEYLVKDANSRTRSSGPARCYISGNKPNGPKNHPPSPQRVARPAAHKRPRCSSPSNLARQKSFRREPDSSIVSSLQGNQPHQKSFRREPERPGSRSSRDLRPISPSPGRRFKGETMITSSMRRENSDVRPHSPKSINSRRYRGSKNVVGRREKNDGIKGVGSKLEELAIGELVGRQEMDWMPIEDANNPHIALDCFIFL